MMWSITIPTFMFLLLEVVSAAAVLAIITLLAETPSVLFQRNIPTVATTTEAFATLPHMTSRGRSKTIAACKEKVQAKYLTPEELKSWTSAAVTSGCKYATCHFMDGTRRSPVPLISYPGSGNTWIRGLLELASGVCTGSSYHDMGLARRGLVGEGIRSGTVLVVKSHNFRRIMQTPGLKQIKSVVLIIRNPFDALVSEWSRKSSRNHTGIVKSSYFGTNSSWNEFVLSNSNRWQSLFITRSIKQHFKLLIVRYEDAKVDEAKEMKRVLSFLNFQYDEEDVAKRLESGYETFKREHLKETFTHYTWSQQKVVNNAIANMIEFTKQNPLYSDLKLDDYYKHKLS